MLVGNGSVTIDALDFLRSAVAGRLNIVVAGGSGAGKTTLLNVLSSFISPNERIVTIEDAAELRLRQRHVITLESRPANAEGAGRVTIRDLLRNALRMRPDRVVIGECRGPESLDMLQAMNTGHDGSLTTVHSNSARDAIARIETMSLMDEMALPLRAIRDQIASGLDLVVHVERTREGRRRVSEICEVGRVIDDTVQTSPLFALDALGTLRRTEHEPECAAKLRGRGVETAA